MTITTTALSLEEATTLTNAIREAVDDLWSLLVKAHDGRAWEAMGYDSWAAYVTAEFRISPGHAGRLLVQGAVIKQISAAANVETVPISARTAVDVAPRVSEITERVAEETQGKHEPTRQAIATEIVQEAATETRRARARVSGDTAFDAIVQEVLAISPKTLARQVSKADCLKLVTDLRKWCDQVVLAVDPPTVAMECNHPINMRIGGTFCGLCQQTVKR